MYFLSRITFFLALLVTLQTTAQTSKSLEKMYNKAENYTYEGNYVDALPLLLKLDSLSPNNANINFNIGLCYIKTIFNKTKAIPYFEKSVKSVSLEYSGESGEKSAPILAYFYLAKAYQLNSQMDQAINNYNQFKYSITKNAAEIPTAAALISDADRELQKCYTAKKMLANPIKIKIENLGSNINSPYSDYAPAVSGDQSTVIFTSRRPGTTGNKKDVDGKYMEDIYMARIFDKEKSWTTFRKMSNNINTPMHEASISISPDGKQMFIYKEGELYISKYKDDDWSKPTPLPKQINTKSWETHASLSPDQKYLYFVSNRPGGYGGRDIWYCRKLGVDIKGDDIWSEAKNIGNVINTQYEEESPYLISDSTGTTLFFSSQGHENMGGFDIYTSKLNADSTWTSPLPLGYPINTTDNDVFFVPANDRIHAYYASAKLGGYGDLDIYRITILNKAEQALESASAEGTPEDKSSISEIEKIDTKPKHTESQENLLSGMTYNKDFYAFLETKTIEKQTRILKGKVTDSINYKPVEAKIKVIDKLKGFAVALIACDSAGQYFISLPTENQYELMLAANNYKGYKVEIDVPVAANSEDIIKDFILSPIIKIETPLIAAIIDTAKIQSQNTVASNIKTNETLAETHTAAITKAENTSGTKVEGSTSISKDLVAVSNPPTKDQLAASNIVKPLKTASVDNISLVQKIDLVIYFEFDSVRLLSDEQKNLNRLCNFLKRNETLVIEVAGHADQLGKEKYNEWIAEERAKIVADYIIKNGIDSNRIKYKGYGASKPSAPRYGVINRARNRRVEFNIIF